MTAYTDTAAFVRMDDRHKSQVMQWLHTHGFKENEVLSVETTPNGTVRVRTIHGDRNHLLGQCVSPPVPVRGGVLAGRSVRIVRTQGEWDDLCAVTYTLRPDSPFPHDP